MAAGGQRSQWMDTMMTLCPSTDQAGELAGGCVAVTLGGACGVMRGDGVMPKVWSELEIRF
jgi:hypothetical protein